jgi:type II secretory pathway component GspD/PulD (secretin)
MKDGETMVIGGLIGSEESKTNNNIPFLSELPLIGTLFKSVHNSKVETEVIVFLTAKLVK